MRSLPPLLVAVSLCACPPTPMPKSVEGPFPQTVGPGGGVLFNEAGVRLEIPAGALAAETTIDAWFFDEEQTLSPEASFVGPGAEFSPRGVTFEKPVKLTMPTSVTKLADYGKAPADCLMWLREADGAWRQAPPVASTDDSVTVETSALGQAAVGARFTFVVSSTHPLARDCVDPSGFCVGTLGEGLKAGNANWSGIDQGRFSYRVPADGGVMVFEYDVVSGAHTRSSGLVTLPKPPSAPPAGAVLATSARIAIDKDGAAWVPLPGQGLVQVVYGSGAKVYPDDEKIGGTVGVLAMADGRLHRAQLVNSRTTGSALSLRSGGPDSAAVGLERDPKSVEVDAVPLLSVNGAPAYLFRTAAKTRAVELRADGGVALPLHPSLAASITADNTIDELAVSPDGRVVAASLLKAVNGGSLFVQSRDGATSLALKLPNLNALEFGEAGALYAASATSPHVYRVDLQAGSVETVVLTSSTDPKVVQAHIPQALRRLWVPATATQKELNGLYVIAGTGDARRVMLVKRAVKLGDCTTLPCQDGGTCIDGPTGPTCLCPVGTTGPQCATDLDECGAPRPSCASGEACTNTAPGFACACPDAMTSGPFCAPATARRISVLAFYDRSFARHENGLPEKAIVQQVNDAKAIFETTTVSGAGLTLGLGAIVDGSRAVPASVLDPTGDATARLTRFDTWVSANQAALTTMVGHPWDFAVLFSGEPLGPSALELSFQSVMCRPHSSAVVARPAGSSQTLSRGARANVFAHTLGHTLGAAHDPSSGFVMSATFDAQAGPLAFSTTSVTAMATYLTTSSSACLEDTPASAWAAPHCGDGVVQESEACDPGIGASDSCCVACQLATGCRCANSDPCCQAGALVADGGVARAARNECDLAERCDGTTSAPPDWVKSPGAACGDGGVCLRGECVPSFDDYCASRFGSRACPAMPFDCSRSYCAAAAVCAMPGTMFFTTPTADGTPCGAGAQCAGGACVASSSLTSYRWAAADFGPCTAGVATRVVSCRDDRGEVVSDALCPPGLRPQGARACP